MPDSPPRETPSSPPHQPPSQQPKETQESETLNPYPNPTTESEELSQNPQPSTPETEIPPPEITFDQQTQPEPEEEEPHSVAEDQECQDEPEPDHEYPEAEGMNVSLSPHPHPFMPSVKGNYNPSTALVRRASKRKKVCKNHASKIAFERKMQQLSQCLKPIPFVPVKKLDFSRHEEFLKKLGLWDFVHVEFDRTLRTDLIAKLIVNYNQKNRGTYVDDCKIGVSRADLGRALKLPKKVDCDVECFPADFLSFLDDFVSNWMILHEDVDLWCMPDEIVQWTKWIKEGTPQKVDWAGLIWFMVEKELSQRTCLKECYYASHLQQMIKVQREELFTEIPDAEMENMKVEVDILKEAVSVEDDEDGGDVKMMDVKESSSVEQKLEEQNTELRLGQDCVALAENVGDTKKVEEDSECHADQAQKVEDVNDAKEVDDVGMSEGVDEGKSKEVDDFGMSEGVDEGKSKEVDDVGMSEGVDEGNMVENFVNAEHNDNADNLTEENKDVDMMDFVENIGEDQGQGHWFLDGKIGGQHFLQPCGMPEVKVSENRGFEGVGEDVEDEELEDDGHVEGFKIMQKVPVDVITSANLMQAFETRQLTYSSTEFRGQSSLELMSSRADDNLMLGGPSMFNHVGKREIDHEHDISHHDLNDNGNHKRIKIEGEWDNKPSEFYSCIDGIKHLLEKAMMCHKATAGAAYQQASMTQHIFEEQLAIKDNDIRCLNYKLDDLQRRKQAEVGRLDRELYLMSSVIDGYRRALKQTQRAFADYRKRCQVPDEPIYKDAGPGGVVKSVMELEKERLKQEEENKMMRNMMEEVFCKNLSDYEVKWETEVLTKVHSHSTRLMDVAKEIELLKDCLMKGKTSADIQNEPEGPSE